MQLCRDCDYCQDHCCCSSFGRHFNQSGECSECRYEETGEEEEDEEPEDVVPNRNARERVKQ